MPTKTSVGVGGVAKKIDRRDFIAAGAGAFFIASGGRVFGASAASNRVRLAIVGCHEKGRGFAVMKSAMKVSGVEIACVCDVDRRAREFAAAYVRKETGLRPKAEKDFRKVLEDRTLDGVISATPDHFHAWSAVMAMRAGKAAYVEKPCCFCPAEGQVLMRVARETGMVLQVGCQRRSSLNFRAAFDWLRETDAIGEMRYARAWYFSDRASVGRGAKCLVPDWLDWDLWQACAPREDFRDNVVHYNWRWFRKWGTSEMGNNATHFADAARWALGTDAFPETVQCSGGLYCPKGGDFEWPDVFNASFKYADGKLITFELACHGRVKTLMDAQTGALVYGQKGALFLGPSDNAVVLDAKGVPVREWTAGGRGKAVDAISLTNPTQRLDVAHLSDFVECIRAKRQTTHADAEQGVKSSVLPLLANIAADCGETLHLDPVTGLPKDGREFRGWSREYQKGWEVA